MITRDDYFMGRDKKYKGELTVEIETNAQVTIDRANLLLSTFYQAMPVAPHSRVNSGWRPAAVNASTPGSAVRSKHLTGEAVDLSDDGVLWTWCRDNQDVLKNIGLWMEHRRDTPQWCHLQVVPPRSGNRVFYAK